MNQATLRRGLERAKIKSWSGSWRESYSWAGTNSWARFRSWSWTGSWSRSRAGTGSRQYN